MSAETKKCKVRKVAERKFTKNYSNLRPQFCPEFYSEISPNFLRSFGVSLCWKRKPEKFTKNPRYFSIQNSQVNSKKKSTKVFWRVGKVKKCPVELRSKVEMLDTRGFVLRVVWCRSTYIHSMTFSFSKLYKHSIPLWLADSRVSHEKKKNQFT